MSIEYSFDPSMSLIAFKIIAEEPPFETPISSSFFGLYFLIIPTFQLCHVLEFYLQFFYKHLYRNPQFLYFHL